MNGQQAPSGLARHSSRPPAQTASKTAKLSNWCKSHAARAVKQTVSTPENGVENRFFLIQAAGLRRIPHGGATGGRSELLARGGCRDWSLTHHLSTIAKRRLKAF